MKGVFGDIINKDNSEILNSNNISCLAKDNLILTSNGYKLIQNISVGDLISTIDNKLSEVVSIKEYTNTQTIYVHGMGIDYIKCTPEQKFLVREHIGRYNKHTDVSNFPSGWRKFSEMKYISAKDLNSKHYFGIQILKFDDDLIDCNSEDFWWLCGAYIGDGCYIKNGIIITCNDNDVLRIEPILKRLQYSYKIHPKQYERNCYNITIKDYKFAEFVERNFGHYSYAKNIPYYVLKLQENKLKAFYKGFLDTDGCILSTNNNMCQFTTVNRSLMCSTGLIVNRIFRRPIRLYYQKRPKSYLIEGRTVNQRDTYQLRFLKNAVKFEHAFVENDFIWFPFSKLEYGDLDSVYSITLKDDTGFIVGNCIVKNN